MEFDPSDNVADTEKTLTADFGRENAPPEEEWGSHRDQGLANSAAVRLLGDVAIVNIRGDRVVTTQPYSVVNTQPDVATRIGAPKVVSTGVSRVVSVRQQGAYGKPRRPGHTSG